MRILSYVINGRQGMRGPEPFKHAVKAISEGVDVISAQGTGLDAGPYYLGSDSALPMMQKEVEPILRAAKDTKTPFVFSLGGAAGGDVHLRDNLRTINDACRSLGIKLRIGLISGEVDKAYLKEKVAAGVKIPRAIDTPRLSEFLTVEEIDSAKRIEAQVGPEPMMELLKEGVEGVITGRALDLGIHMAYPLAHGVPRAMAAHMAKLIECASMTTVGGQPYDFILAEVEGDSFTLRPTNPNLRCTERSVAVHSLYEREDPMNERNPGGVLDVSKATYEQVDERTVRCRGAQWHDEPYTVKLEGVRSIGFQNLTVHGIRDAQMIRELDGIIQWAKDDVRRVIAPETFEVVTHVFGRDAVLGHAEPLRGKVLPHEVALVVILTARTQALANRLGNLMRHRIFMADFPGRKTIAGNTASVLQLSSPGLGEAYVFNVWHLLPLSDPGEPFRREIVEFPMDEARLQKLFGGRP